jgi:hypothetical protein
MPQLLFHTIFGSSGLEMCIHSLIILVGKNTKSLNEMTELSHEGKIGKLRRLEGSIGKFEMRII